MESDHWAAPVGIGSAGEVVLTKVAVVDQAPHVESMFEKEVVRTDIVVAKVVLRTGSGIGE